MAALTKLSTSLPVAILLAAGLYAAALPAQAGVLGLTSFTPGSSTSNRNSTLGWQFRANSAFTVDSLGWWDAGADGLGEAHQVGLWSLDGTLLRSTTVQSGTGSASSGGTIGGGVFRFESIASILLTAGTEYVIGGYFTDKDVPQFDADPITTDAAISWVQGRGNFGGGSFVFPNDTFANTSYFGPNFTIATNDVPEPGTLSLMLLAAGAMLWATGRKQAR